MIRSNFLIPLSSKLDEKDIQRLNTNAWRVLDSKNSETQDILKDAPKINDYLTDQSLNLLKKAHVFFKTRKELDNLCGKDGIQHQGVIAEIEPIDDISL